MDKSDNTIRPHITYWLAAGLGLLWHLGGCLNYIMQTDPAAVADMPEVYQTIIATRPAWGTAAFAFAVFGGAVGCILLLLRRRVAMSALAVSLLGTLGVAVDTVLRVGAVPSLLLSLLVASALVWFASISMRRGLLR